MQITRVSFSNLLGAKWTINKDLKKCFVRAVNGPIKIVSLSNTDGTVVAVAMSLVGL